MLITILAVTKAWNDFSIAGMNENGQWIRPIVSEGSVRFWPRGKLMVENGFIKCGDVWEIQGHSPSAFMHPNHTEDFVAKKFKYHHSLTNNELIEFLREKVEDEQAFLDTVNARRRSLCLVNPKTFIPDLSYWDGQPKPKMRFKGNFDFDNPHTNNRDYIVKDCKWCGLMTEGVNMPEPSEIYLCIGLATPTKYDGIEYPQVIGLHTYPLAPFSPNYPD